MRECAVRDLGRMSYREALEIQLKIASERKQGLGIDHLLFVEHPPVVTIGRNGHWENVLAPGKRCGAPPSKCMRPTAAAT